MKKFTKNFFVEKPKIENFQGHKVMLTEKESRREEKRENEHPF